MILRNKIGFGDNNLNISKIREEKEGKVITTPPPHTFPIPRQKKNGID